MESFDLTKEDLLGFDDTMSHAVIKSKDNIIYSKISPETVSEVRSFFKSF